MGSERVQPCRSLKDIDLDALEPALVEEVEAWLARWPRRQRPAEQAPPTAKRVAYFCMEYGLHESLPIYSGGLGMLAGTCAAPPTSASTSSPSV